MAAKSDRGFAFYRKHGNIYLLLIKQVRDDLRMVYFYPNPVYRIIMYQDDAGDVKFKIAGVAVKEPAVGYNYKLLPGGWKIFDISRNTKISDDLFKNEMIKNMLMRNLKLERLRNIVQECLKELLEQPVEKGAIANAVKDIENDALHKGLNKKWITTIEDEKGENIFVYAVNGSYIKAGLKFIEFVEGGNHYVDADLPKNQQKYAKHIPENEVWVDDVFETKPEDFNSILKHEMTERNRIKYHGKSYNQAHEKANAIELKNRREIEGIPSAN